MKKKICAALALMVVLLAMGACKKNNEQAQDENNAQTEQNAGAPTEGTNQPQTNSNDSGTGSKTDAREEDNTAKIKFSTDEVNDSCALKDSGVQIYYKKLQKLKVVASDRDYTENAKKISSTMQNAYTRHDKEATELKNSALDYVVENYITEPWCLEVSYTGARNDGKVISILEQVYYSAGGPHPTTANFGYNFDVKTGEVITLDNLIAGADDKESEELKDSTNALIKKKLDDQYGKENFSDDYLTGTYVDTAGDSWHFNEDGTSITLIFNQYDIAPYAGGSFEITLTKDELPAGAAQYFN